MFGKYDRTYCDNKECPFKDCFRHISNRPKLYKYLSIADYSGTCRRYITWLVNEVQKDE